MIELTLINDENKLYRVKISEPSTFKEFKAYANMVLSVKNRGLDTSDFTWIMRENDAFLLRDVLNNPDVCEGMKLTPYNYQKQGILYGAKHKAAIFNLPCGAGKTIIGLGLIYELRRQKKVTGKSVIIVKASLKTQWQHERDKATNLSSRIIQTYAQCTNGIRSKIKRRENKLKNKLLPNAYKMAQEIITVKQEIEELKKEADNVFLSQFNDDTQIFIMNYETLADEKVREAMHETNIQLFFVDEVDMIKDHTTHKNKNLCEFNDVEYRFGATATVVRKNPQDLFGIFRFIDKNLFPKITSFNSDFVMMNRFNRPSGSKNETKLRAMISPYIFSKTLEEISDELPTQSVFELHCSLTAEQEAMNERIEAETEELKNDQLRLLETLGPIKCQADQQYKKNEGNIIARQTFAQMLADSEELLAMSNSNMAKSYITNSPSSKVELCLDLISKIVQSGEKVCIFSRFLGIQEIIKREIAKTMPEIKVEQIYGSVSDEERHNIVTRYNKDGNVLLLSDAGEAGLNLSTTKYMIEFELADSAAKQTQRHGRIRRADSTHRNSFVYQLIADNSYDEIARKIINKKEKYTTDIMAGV